MAPRWPSNIGRGIASLAARDARCMPAMRASLSDASRTSGSSAVSHGSFTMRRTMRFFMDDSLTIHSRLIHGTLALRRRRGEVHGHLDGLARAHLDDALL